jgi:hypothetical protein
LNLVAGLLAPAAGTQTDWSRVDLWKTFTNSFGEA